jgi:hypothetical protein
MKDNFDLKKFLLENKIMENSNPYSSTTKKKNIITEGNLRDKIREMILKEVDDEDLNPDLEERGFEDEIGDDVTSLLADLDDVSLNEEEVEDESEEETEEEEIEDDPADDDEATFGTIAADMEGSESEIMDNLMAALKAAKEVGNEKLSTQIGNTLKFFVSEFIGGGEQ